MSSSLIKMTSTLKTHPKINQLASLLENPTDGSAGLAVAVGSQQSAMMTRNISRSVAITSLIIIWNAAKEFAHEGVFHNADPSYLDSLADYPGFGEAMIASGWAVYNKKKKCITLAGISEDQKVVDVKKSPGARRQKAYRERLKMKKCLSGCLTVGYRSPCTKRTRAIAIPNLVREDNGITRFGSIVIEGVAYEVTCNHNTMRSDSSRNVTKTVTHGVTQSITETVTVVGSGVTQSNKATDMSVSSGLTAGLTEPAMARGSGVAQAITDSVTAHDSSVTQGITDSVTRGITPRDSAVTLSQNRFTRPEISSRVIPSRAHTRFGFLRSKILKSKPKKTHTAREENFRPVDNLQTKTTCCQTGKIFTGATHPNPQRKRVGQAKKRLRENQFNAKLSVTQSLTLLRLGNESVCLTRKQFSRNTPQQPARTAPPMAAFPMHPGWKPSADFLSTVQRIGIELKSDPDEAELTEFVGYWAAGQAEHTQQQWEFKLGRCLSVGRRRGRKRYSAQRDITIIPSADYEIPEGFRGG
ncbi:MULTISPECIES: DnaT-like ssDNA-binding domain-containing protein [unclassified Pantoea]|uniref:DnaT-like ssDNA-binding domain-containing protein n=1 Tax=unclassified Pantoea TaxID=2630326 RepID=UPI001CD32CD1|nr:MULTISPECIES: DnaT-like ssDNA-binding domain-containing protein [unclassified Pantoea]MCA1176679.1 hypothetical protein [Pantoea sp. alder69]MCA1251592.1 hypothetical protein [Pantoea sp. alder70]MCA1264277.1 hypothetical protein [Pantoea sp. alder81]